MLGSPYSGIEVTTVTSEQGESTDVVIWPAEDVQQELFLGLRTSPSGTLMYPLNKLLVLHINGCGAVTHVHPDTGRALVSFDADAVRQIVLALADVRRPWSQRGNVHGN